MAGRIPQYFIDDLVARADIVDVVGSAVKLKKSGRNWHGLCPFHNEKTPSFTVSQDKQFYHCFGCGAHGNAIGFLMEHDGLGYVEAIEDLAKQLGMEVPRDENPAEAKKRQAAKKSAETLELAAQFYRNSLQVAEGCQRAQAYLQHRGLKPETVERFGIGYAPDGWELLKKYLAGQSISEGEQVSLGLLVQKEDTGRSYDRFRNRIMFPIRDWRGKVIAFGGRVLGDEKPKYLNSPETPVFQKGRELYGLYEAKTSPGQLERLLVVEGYMDVVALAEAGISYAVATLGTSATSEHMERLFKVVPEVVFCFDGDKAGKRAAERALDNVLPHMIDGRQARFMFLPEGQDPDTLVRANGKNLFEQRIVRADSLSEYLFRFLQQSLNPLEPEGKALLIQKAIPYFKKIPAGILRTLLIQKLAEIVGVDADGVRAQIDNSLVAASHEPVQSQPVDIIPDYAVETGAPADKNPEVKLSTTYAYKLLVWAVRYPHICQALSDVEQQQLKEIIEENKDFFWGKVFDLVFEYLKCTPGATTSSLQAHWYGTETGRLLDQIALEEVLAEEFIVSEFKEWLRSLELKRREYQHNQRFDELTRKSRSGQKLTKNENEELVMLLNLLANKKSQPDGNST
ncbi:DNA primase [Oceanospirillum linum]|uniref:DNA primase n=2 Tax=Oceanospirillum TaxID=965 RepID=A0A1T1HF56_OCELI|nr:DNA primase [Oceanospirillum linum]OOV88463.1 DNA primase [Oceanospirillum linum]SEF57289.1 DNA primase [Oleiphilus messinensis]SMP05841.1 DNA primase [Oceanospirillum linum]